MKNSLHCNATDTNGSLFIIERFIHYLNVFHYISFLISLKGTMGHIPFNPNHSVVYYFPLYQ